MENKMFNQIWEQLRARKGQYSNFLDQITIKNLRGISDLPIEFNYPVTVIAGPNACGKSTVLFTCACAYEPSNSNPRNYTPASLFPNLSVLKRGVSDQELHTSFEFHYTINRKKVSMRWAKGKSWNKSYMGQKNSKQPKSDIYLRTLANLASPSEVRALLQISNSPVLTIDDITSDLLAFAQRILPIQYSKVSLIKKENRDLLFVHRDNESNNASYSEFHMSAGERAILRISKDISNLRNALILIDEIEAGLHPFTQRQLMLELQRIALRNDLQIIVTSHSPVILDSVPLEARIFLERTDDNVIEKPAYKDIIQKALYGQSTEKLSLLCEDEIGENFVLGVLDFLNPKLNLIHDDIKVGRDTGKEEFPAHIMALGKFSKLNEFIFVLDGDAKNMDSRLKEAAARTQASAIIQPLYLPGKDIPETWAWEIIKEKYKRYATLFGLPEDDLNRMIQRHNQLYDNASDKPTNRSKNKFFAFCEQIRRSSGDIIRIISREETTQQTGEIKTFTDELELQIRGWQSRK
jgi:AAA15 family ATPase/GTPase